MNFKEQREESLRSMYASIAHRYDLLNNIMSLNQVNFWRRFAASRCGLRPGGSALDVACGTGLLALELARIVGASGRVIGVDFCAEMLDQARANIDHSLFPEVIRLTPGQATQLAFADNTFDCAVIGFALHAVPGIEQTISEMIRVVKPGGKVVNLELAVPGVPVFKQAYALYLNYLIPLLGQWGVGRKEPYQYLAASVQDFVPPSQIVKVFRELGLADVQYYELTGGIAVVQDGTKIPPA